MRLVDGAFVFFSILSAVFWLASAFQRLQPIKKWEPLLAIADACGPDWGKRARAAAVKLSASTVHVDHSQSLGVMLLKDIRDLFEEIESETTPKTGKSYKEIASVKLASILAERDDRPWAEHGRSKKPVTPRGIASLLEGFQIRPKEIAHGKMGYREKQFAHAFRRYLLGSPEKRKKPRQCGRFYPRIGQTQIRG